jgi:hypothetical protein
LHDVVPNGGVVHATLPGVADIHEPLTLRVSLPVEIIVPGAQFGEGVLQEVSRLRLVRGIPVDI